MAKESMDKFLSDSIADHEWLDAKDRVNAPFSDSLKRDKKPELAVQYTMPNLIPEYDVSAPKAVDPNKNDGKVAVVLNEVKRQMMAGKSLNHIKETIIDRLPEAIKVAAKDELVKVAQEYPLLGSVYIDADTFKTEGSVKGCESGNDLVKNSSKLAIYVKKMAACGNCSLNKGGFCRVYKKALVDKVPYTAATFDHYRNHLILSNKLDYGQKLASKDDLKTAMLSNTPFHKEASSYVYHDEAKIYTSSLASPTASFEDKEKRNLERDLSLKLAAGMQPEDFKNYVMEKYATSYHAYPEVFKKYADYVGSLGNVFIELDVFNTLKEASEFTRRYPKAKYVVTANTSIQIDLAGIQQALGKKVVSDVNEIPLSAWKVNLKEGSYNLEELASNPLAVMKKAAFYKAPERDVTASYQGKDDPVISTPELEFDGYNPKPAMAKKASDSNYNKVLETVEQAINITQTGNKVSAKYGDEFSVDLEPADFDDSVKKYL